MFSKACEHGLKAMIYIASKSMEGERVKIGEVAEHTGTPEAFTAKVLSTLSRHELLHSIKGPYGGFEMDQQQMHQVRLVDIVSAIDGDKLFEGCALGLTTCNEDKPCPMHNSFVQIRTDLKSMMESTSIYDLATGLISGESILIR
ncbi:RrF2 family transcriptional regulator [Sphingobacterium sp. CZ-2]|uniref:RrF2 family transcriptional regulator n=1 Tax=Sphingobacterium sp. CZ-2 TaxID=2557994 RepID=UPI00106F79E1|nr:Rrf2 family transcriptional regulator [Sphingobacterium sp. CZ-2]QBR12894.1 Rrf2 family transcriptional regulator [Sphingobacterium sp. CZ-2]